MAVAPWIQHRAFYERPAERWTIHKIWRVNSNTAGVLGTNSCDAPWLARLDLDLGCPHSYDVLASGEDIRNFGVLRSMIGELARHPFIVDGDSRLGGWLEAPREYRDSGPFVFGMGWDSIVGDQERGEIVVADASGGIRLDADSSEKLHTVRLGTSIPRITGDSWALAPHTRSDGGQDRVTIMNMNDHNHFIITNSRALHSVAILMGAPVGMQRKTASMSARMVESR